MKTVDQNKNEELMLSFLENGFSGMDERQVLEVLLTFAMPDANTHEIVEKIFDYYKTFLGILLAPSHVLIKDFGIDNKAAALIKAVPNILERYTVDNSINVIYSPESVAEIFLNALRFSVKERIMACFLDESLEIIARETINAGNHDEAFVDPLWIVACSQRVNSHIIVLGHNHPVEDVAALSESDVVSTNHLRRVLGLSGIWLLDHVIVTPNGNYLSMKEDGTLHFMTR